MTADADRRAWLEERRKGVGASDVAGIMGRSPWASPYSIWADKVGLVDLDDDPTPSQALGRELEGLVARWFHDETGLELAGEQMVIRRPGTPWFATVDGLVFDGRVVLEECDVTDALGVFEAKVTSARPDEWADELPPQYVIQCGWAMYCADLPRAWLAALHLAFGHPVLRVYEIERDPALEADMVEAAERFWGYVERREPPPADAHPATTRALTAAHPEGSDDPEGLELPQDVVETVALLRDLKDRRAELDDLIAGSENTLREALGEHRYGRVMGRLVVSWKPQTSQRVDTKAVRRDHGHAYDRESTTRVLRLHEGKR